MPADQRSVVELLYQVSREFASALDLRVVLQRVLFAALTNVGGERGTVLVLDDAGRMTESAIVYGNELRPNITIQLKDTVERGLAGWVMRNRDAAFVPDTSKDERWLRRADDAVDRTGAKSAICVPLLARERLVGVLTLVHPTPNSYDREAFELMRAIADQAGMAILNARLYAESQRQARVMTALAEAAAGMNTSLRMEEAFERILHQCKQALQVGTAALGLIESSSGELVFRAAIGEDAEKITGQRIKAKGGIAGLVIRDGRGVVVPAVTDDTLLADAEQALGRVISLVCAPIHAQGRVIGVLEGFNPIEKTFDPDALLVLTGLGSLAGTVIQNALLYEKLDISRRRYTDLFEDSIDAIFITDLNGRIQEANHRAAIFSGYPAAQLRNLLIEHIYEVNVEKLGRSFEKVCTETVVYESVLGSREGEKRPVEISVRRVSFEDIEAIQWIVRDISERKELDSLREDMTAMIYHDLRSPLANVISSLDMLPNSEKESAGTLLKIANHSASRLQRLINSLLDLNRLEQNQLVGDRQDLSLRALADDLLDAVQPSADARKQTIRFDLPENPPALLVDVDMTRRILINLVENAIKYTPIHGKILVGAHEEGDWMRLWVEDNGPGIPDAERERIFHKFIRIKGNGRGNPGGLGVGLAFCKLAVHGHGGTIWVEAVPEGGARFVFTLPLKADDTPG